MSAGHSRIYCGTIPKADGRVLLFGSIIIDEPKPPASLDDTAGLAEPVDAGGRMIRALDFEQVSPRSVSFAAAASRR